MSAISDVQCETRLHQNLAGHLIQKGSRNSSTIRKSYQMIRCCAERCYSILQKPYQWLKNIFTWLWELLKYIVCDSPLRYYVSCIYRVANIYAISPWLTDRTTPEHQRTWILCANLPALLMKLIQNWLGLNLVDSQLETTNAQPSEHFLLLEVSKSMILLYFVFVVHIGACDALKILIPMALLVLLGAGLVFLPALTIGLIAICLVVLMILYILYPSHDWAQMLEKMRVTLAGMFRGIHTHCLNPDTTRKPELLGLVVFHFLVVGVVALFVPVTKTNCKFFLTLLGVAAGASFYVWKASIADIQRNVAYISHIGIDSFGVYVIVQLSSYDGKKPWYDYWAPIVFAVVFCVLLPLVYKILFLYQVRKICTEIPDLGNTELYNFLDRSGNVYASMFVRLKSNRWWWPLVEDFFRNVRFLLSLEEHQNWAFMVSFVSCCMVLLYRPYKVNYDSFLLGFEWVMILLMDAICWCTSGDAKGYTVIFVLLVDVPLVCLLIAFGCQVYQERQNEMNAMAEIARDPDTDIRNHFAIDDTIIEIRKITNMLYVYPFLVAFVLYLMCTNAWFGVRVWINNSRLQIWNEMIISFLQNLKQKVTG